MDELDDDVDSEDTFDDAAAERVIEQLRTRVDLIEPFSR